MKVPIPRRRGARAEALWATASFLMVTAACWGVIEVRCPYWLDREYEVRRSLLADRIAEAPDRPVVLVIGSSRIGAGFMPERCTGLGDGGGRAPIVFNYSALEAGPRMNLMQLHRALRDGVRPAALVVELAPIFLVHDASPLERASVQDCVVLSPYTNRLGLAARAVGRRARGLYVVRTRALRWAAPAFATAPKNEPDVVLYPSGGSDRWVREDAVSPAFRREWTGKVRAVYGTQLQRFRVASPSVAATWSLLELARDLDLPVVLLLTPEDSAFRSWYPPGAAEAFQETMAGLAAEFTFRLVDARQWVPDDGFSDPHHLNLKGAELFTDRFANEVLAPLLNRLARTGWTNDPHGPGTGPS